MLEVKLARGVIRFERYDVVGKKRLLFRSLFAYDLRGRVLFGCWVFCCFSYDSFGAVAGVLLRGRWCDCVVV